jgi:hypothetical protein
MSVYTLQKLLRDVNRILAYEAVKPWATGVGLMSFGAAA